MPLLLVVVAVVDPVVRLDQARGVGQPSLIELVGPTNL